MSATGKKTGRGGNAMKYYLMGTELGLSGKQGFWHDPQQIFAQYGVQEGQEVGRERAKELLCLARGFNPLTAASAFNKYGSFNPAEFTKTIWLAASKEERKDIARTFAAVGIKGIYANTSGERVAEKVGHLFGTFNTAEVITDVLKTKPEFKNQLIAALQAQKVDLRDDASLDQIFQAYASNDKLKAPQLFADLWQTEKAREDLADVLKAYGVRDITKDSGAKEVAEAIKLAEGRFNVDADQKSEIQNKVERAIAKAARTVKGTQFCVADQPGMHRASGYDWTFEAPREISLIWAMGDEATRAKIDQIMMESAQAGVAYFNKHAGVTRVKGPDDLHFEIEAQFGCAMFNDSTGRPVSMKGDPHPTLKKFMEMNQTLGGQHGVFIDPHKHIHVVFPNLAACSDGKYRAIETRYFMLAHQGAQEAAHAALADQMQREFGLTIVREEGKMAFSAAEVRREFVELMSKRREGMLAAAEAMGIDRADFNKLSQQFQEWIKLDQRNPHLTVTDEELNAHWLMQGELMGFGAKEVSELLANCKARHATETAALKDSFTQHMAEAQQAGMDERQILAILRATPEDKRQADRSIGEMWQSIRQEITDVGTLMHRERGMSAFSADAFRAEVLKRFTGRLPGDMALAEANRALREDFSSLGRFDGKDMTATHAWIGMEAATVDLAVFARHQNMVNASETEAAIERMNKRLGEQGYSLSENQTGCIRFMLNTDSMVCCVSGPPGAGKTTVLLPAVEAFKASGYDDIVGVALSWSASGVLKDSAKLSSSAAVEKLVWEIKKGRKLTNRTVVILDESSLTGSEHLSVLLRAAASAEGGPARVVLVGDENQINSVAAGSAFSQIIQEKFLADGVGAYRLTEVRRQKDYQDSMAIIGLVEPDRLLSSFQDKDGRDLRIASIRGEGNDVTFVCRIGEKDRETTIEVPLEEIRSKLHTDGKPLIDMDVFLASIRKEDGSIAFLQGREPGSQLDPKEKKRQLDLFGAKYLLEFDKAKGRFHLEGTRDQAVDAALNKYAELREKYGESVLITAFRNDTVDALNVGVREYLKEKGQLPKEEVLVNVLDGTKEKTIAVAVGDLIQFRKKTVGTSEADQAYNRTAAKVLKIEGEGDNAVITAQLYSGDELTDRVITVSKDSFNEGKLCMCHNYANSVDSSQGKTVNGSIDLHENDGQQRRVVNRSRHRYECHTFANLDDLHKSAAKMMDADHYTNRNAFSMKAGEGVLVAQWAQSERKTTTLQFIADRNIKAGMSCLHGSRFAQNATIAAALEEARELVNRTRSHEHRAHQGQDFNARSASQEEIKQTAEAFKARTERKFAYGDQEIRVKSPSKEDIHAAMKEAAEKFGAGVKVDDIQVSGSRSFRQAAKEYMATMKTKVRAAAKDVKQAATDAYATIRDHVAHIKSRSMYAKQDYQQAAKVRAENSPRVATKAQQQQQARISEQQQETQRRGRGMRM